VAIFAAACNEGDRSGVSYPANHRSVFSVRAINGLAKHPDFNPDPTKGKLNASILGTNILSTWPTKLCKSDSPNDNEGPKERNISKIPCATNYMTGTSFATPLMAALIANVYSYYREHRPKIFTDALADWQPKLQCFDGVEKMIRAMSENKGDHTVISPWKAGNNFCDYSQGGIYWPMQHALKWRREN
jgi:hypothetical protein